MTTCVIILWRIVKDFGRIAANKVIFFSVGLFVCVCESSASYISLSRFLFFSFYFIFAFVLFLFFFGIIILVIIIWHFISLYVNRCLSFVCFAIFTIHIYTCYALYNVKFAWGLLFFFLCCCCGDMALLKCLFYISHQAGV